MSAVLFWSELPLQDPNFVSVGGYLTSNGTPVLLLKDHSGQKHKIYFYWGTLRLVKKILEHNVITEQPVPIFYLNNERSNVAISFANFSDNILFNINNTNYSITKTGVNLSSLLVILEIFITKYANERDNTINIYQQNITQQNVPQPQPQPQQQITTPNSNTNTPTQNNTIANNTNPFAQNNKFYGGGGMF